MYENGQLRQKPTELAVELNGAAVSQALIERRGLKRRGSEMGSLADEETFPAASSTALQIPPLAKIKKNSVHHQTAATDESMASESLMKVEVTDSDCVVIDDDDANGVANDDGGNPFPDCDDAVAHPSQFLNHVQPRSVDAVFDAKNPESHSGFFDALPSPHLEEQKLEAIVGTEDPWMAYDKRNLEYKLWMSVLYSAGKNMAFSCPYSDRSTKNEVVRNYFSDRCAQFMQRCLRMLPDKESRREMPPPAHDALKGQSIVGFVKHSIRHGYKQGCKELGRMVGKQLDDASLYSCH